MSWWKFELTSTHLLIRTPWFAFYWAEFAQDLYSCTYWRGFEFHWKANKKLKEGELFFLKSYVMKTDVLNASELI